ncbi:PEP-CTERM sorting domain-containing protein [Zavarzinella formosa]|uniref:PEP-CTERM sorting domain-containing protein n=1 Tax=Zavarzinella formosa TaxID=360055 RepID=UPI000315E294|nr:PEP-CTERM sorting domain-containing protein [Zavarzinella formosa]
MTKYLLGIPVLLLMIEVSRAGLLPGGLVVTREGDSSAYRFTYSVELQSKSVLQPGDYFTIYDFAGRVDGTETQPANFSFSSSPVGPTPDLLSPHDDPNVSNLTWTYTGKTVLSGEALLGEFSAVSLYPNKQSDDFTGQSHKESDGHFNNNITDTVVPVPSSVPEPSTWIMGGIGLIGMLGYGWYRSRTRSNVIV